MKIKQQIQILQNSINHALQNVPTIKGIVYMLRYQFHTMILLIVIQ